MKFFILSCLIACASASVVLSPHHAVVAAPAHVSTGHSTQSRTQDAAGNYQFSYNEQHSTGGSSRAESGSHGVKQGSYTLNVADGRQRVVNYVADGLGFRASIATNEPGTAAQPAASTAISSPYLPPAPVAPLAVAAPAVHAPALIAEPVVHHAPILSHHAVAPVVNAAPFLHAPVHHAAIVPAVSSFSSVVNHGVLAQHHAPLAVAHHGAPILAHHY